jgi:hypothetical protein
MGVECRGCCSSSLLQVIRKQVTNERGGRNAALFLFTKETAPLAEGLLYGSDASLHFNIRVKVMYTEHATRTKKFMRST